MAMTDPAVSVVVPVRNEAGNITLLVSEIAQALDGRRPFEVIYVNDGSSDNTDAELKQLMAQRAWLRCVAPRDAPAVNRRRCVPALRLRKHPSW